MRPAFALTGLGLVVYGLVGLVGSTSRRGLISATKWFIGGALTHDILLAPVVTAIGVAVIRWVPGRIRPYVQAGLFITAALTLVALPFLSGRGYRRTNPSALPLDYGRGYGIAVAIVWLAITIIAFARSRHRAKSADRR